MRDRNLMARLSAGLLAAAFSFIALTSVAEAQTDVETPQPPVEQAAPDKDQIRSYQAARRDLDADAFRRAFEGKTVHLSSGDMHYGSEYYMPGDRSLWIASQGPCRLGSWTYEAGLFCFRYAEDGPYCWRVYESGGTYFAESMEGLVLEIYAVEEKPLQCDPELYSAAPDGDYPIRLSFDAALSPSSR